MTKLKYNISDKAYDSILGQNNSYNSKNNYDYKPKGEKEFHQLKLLKIMMNFMDSCQCQLMQMKPFFQSEKENNNTRITQYTITQY